jgi:hypothetical protein
VILNYGAFYFDGWEKIKFLQSFFGGKNSPSHFLAGKTRPVIFWREKLAQSFFGGKISPVIR